ncbi:putative O-methyltransferase YrrM [Caulobacter ginsengisoli]|uniref:O-methyltransferase YrrM n=1 Tax=Caulobacter ginsengisoli TaxID=400775 RepID=A0ABU0IMA3_9CAUL|nr:class I SAM-dependent methyltransferase [Caulobacter ginsengisoli]MDQ0463132.1 putative O-methyltransferase YrrM [Caulobacter ginsengisoli]
MAATTQIRQGLNRLLRPLNIELKSLTADRQEQQRIQALIQAGLLDKQIFPLSPGMDAFDPTPLAETWSRCRADLARLQTVPNPVGYDPTNTYYANPDMEVLYLLIRMLAPGKVVEIGCGSSTRITRQAIRDGALATQIIAIDPYPRNDIAPFVDRFEKTRVEELADYSVFESLEAGDILFVDSSHEVRVGNDVARIFCDIIPRLKPGVILHFHDIFLPFDYPPADAERTPEWGEQYVLHAWLQHSGAEILWAGRYVQLCRPDVRAALPFLGEAIAQSFWFRLA